MPKDKKEKSKGHIWIYIVICILIAIVSFTAGFFMGDRIYIWLCTPFCNTNGQFDYEIMWAAVGAVGTIIVSGVAIWQTSRANNMSKDLISLENNKYRPYIKLKMQDTFFINKEAFGFSEATQDEISKAPLSFNGVAQQEEKYKTYNNCFWPTAGIFFFSIKNIGESSISQLSLKRLIVLDTGTGIVSGFSSNVDTSVFSGEEKQIAIQIQEQVLPLENGTYNRISENYAKSLQQPIRHAQIEMAFLYTDIYGRTFDQEYTVRFEFDLKGENQTEYIIKSKNISVEHHVGLSPYGPRIDE